MFEKIKTELEKYHSGREFGRDVVTMRVDGIVENMIEAIEEVEKEYNNGWIPVEERLPEEFEDVEVTVEEIANEVGGKRYYTTRSWLQKGKWVIKKNPYCPTVIAWKYPTEPYKKEVE